jgi:hypothetical protein
MSVCSNPNCPREGEEFLPAYPGMEFCSAKCRSEAKKYTARNRANKPTTVGRRKDPRFISDDLVCQHPNCHKKKVHDHHVIYAQVVERMGGDVGDPDNALGICFDCHGTHHKQIKKLPISCLHDRNFDFAYTLLGLAATDYLRRHYAGDDERIPEWEKKVRYGVLSVV